MKKIFTVVTLVLLASSAQAWTCQPWIDKDGFKRYKCSETTDPVIREAWKQHVEASPKVSNRYKFLKNGDNGSFTIYDTTAGSFTHCTKTLTGSVECW